MSEEIIIAEHELPIRIDRYLRTIDPFMTQGVIEKSLREGRIKVNGIKVKSNYRISNGDKIVFANKIPPKSLKPDVKNSTIVVALAKKLLSEYLISDHRDFLAINKPAGIPSQGGTKISLSLDDALSYLNSKNFDLRLVHRLDKDTSGVMLISKNRDAAIKLTGGFKDHKIYKTYFACVSPVPKESSGKIASYLIKTSDFEVKSYATEVPDSKLAITNYQVIKSEGDIALVKFTPETGRMHQLRVHSKEMGCPIIGDERYGGVESKYLMLHSAEAVIDKTVLGEEVVIKVKIPEYFPLVN